MRPTHPPSARPARLSEIDGDPWTFSPLSSSPSLGGNAVRGRARLRHRIAQDADTLDLAFNDVARQAVARRGNEARLVDALAAQFLVRRPGGAGRRAGDDDHAGPEREIAREEVNELGAGPDHVRRAARLAQF